MFYHPSRVCPTRNSLWPLEVLTCLGKAWSFPGQQKPPATSTQIGLITWSDHALVSLELFASPDKRYRRICSLLSHLSYQEKIKTEVHNFFELNTGSVSDDALLWNVHKAYTRVLLIKFGAQENKLHKQAISKTLQDIRIVERSHKSTHNPQDEAELQKLITQLHSPLHTNFDIYVKRLRTTW